MKKAVLTITALLMIAGVLCATGEQDTGAANRDPLYPITISVYTQQPRQQPPANNKIDALIKERFKVSFSWDILVGDSIQKRGIMIASGDYPDLIEINETAFIDAGACIPLEDLIEQYGPNIKAHYADVWEKMKSPDGHIYYLINWGIYHGLNQSPYYGDSALWVQKEVLKEAGYPRIVTMDEYFDLLIAYAKKHPTINGLPTIPFTILTYDWHAFCMWNPPNFLAGYPNEGNGTVDPVTHKYTNFFTQDISKRWFKKLNELNAQGYIDKSAFVDNYDQYLAKIASGRVLGLHDQRWQFAQGDDALRDQNMYNRTMAPLPIVFDRNIRPRYRNIPIPNIGRGVGISVKAKDPVRIIRFLNEWLSEDWQRVIEWGVEGEDWQRNAKGEPYRTPSQRANWENQIWQLRNREMLLREVLPTWEGSWSDGYPTLLEDYYPEREALTRPEDKELWAAYGVTSNAELMDKSPPPNALWFPTWSMPNPPDGSKAQIAQQRYEQVMRKYLPQVILAQPAQFESLWAEYVREMGKAGMADYEAYMQEQLNLRIKLWSAK
ncbi:MAG: extracellular solute-binding protein [Spirochaetaceae bacterium]|nr:extracellular solute-binding protein [Spirochaetaceae bacterium]